MITYWAGLLWILCLFPSSILFPLAFPEREREKGGKKRGKEMRIGMRVRKDKLTREKMMI